MRLPAAFTAAPMVLTTVVNAVVTIDTMDVTNVEMPLRMACTTANTPSSNPDATAMMEAATEVTVATMLTMTVTTVPIADAMAAATDATTDTIPVIIGITACMADMTTLTIDMMIGSTAFARFTIAVMMF